MKKFYMNLIFAFCLSLLSTTNSYALISEDDGQGCKATCPHGTCHWDGKFGVCSCNEDGYPECEKIGLTVSDINTIENVKGEVIADEAASVQDFLKTIRSNLNPEIQELK